MPDSISSWGDRAGAEDDFALGPHDALAAAAPLDAHAHGAVALELDAEDHRGGEHLEVGALHVRSQVGIGGAEARALALRDLHARRAVLLWPVVVGHARDASSLGGGQEAGGQRPR
jgi:hypothetical protein